jgi:hypothetical protein
MARANAILVGAIVLAPTIVGAEGYAIYHRLHRPPKQSAEVAPPAEHISQDLPAPSPPAVETPAPPPPPRQPEVAAPPPPDDGTTGEIDPTTARRQRALYERRAQVIQDADEQAFDTLNLSDAQRAAIRAIDEQYARTLTTIANATDDSTLPTFTVDSNAEQTRRTAIAGVLGPDTVHTFNFVERKAERRVRNHYRPDVVRGY